MKKLSVVAFAVALLCQAMALAAIRPAFRLIVMDTKAPVSIITGGGAGLVRNGSLTVSQTCLTFRDMDARTVNRVRFRFVYYDKSGKRVGGDVFDRRGAFSMGVPIQGYDARTSTPFLANCAAINYPREGIAINIVYVESVDFTDGTSWTAAPVALVDQLGQHGAANAAIQSSTAGASTPNPAATATPDNDQFDGG